MASSTGYIVWDSVRHILVGGPFPTSAQATSFLARAQKNNEGASGKAAKVVQFTVETVTLN